MSNPNTSDIDPILQTSMTNTILTVLGHTTNTLLIDGQQTSLTQGNSSFTLSSTGIVTNVPLSLSSQKLTDIADPTLAQDAVSLNYLQKALTSVVQDRDYINVYLDQIQSGQSINTAKLNLTSVKSYAGTKIQEVSGYLYATKGDYELRITLEAVFKANTGMCGIYVYFQDQPDQPDQPADKILKYTIIFQNPATSLGKTLVSCEELIEVPDVEGRYITFVVFGFGHTLYSVLNNGKCSLNRQNVVQGLFEIDNLPNQLLPTLNGITSGSIKNLDIVKNAETGIVTVSIKYDDNFEEQMIINTLNKTADMNFSKYKVNYPTASQIAGKIDSLSFTQRLFQVNFDNLTFSIKGYAAAENISLGANASFSSSS